MKKVILSIVGMSAGLIFAMDASAIGFGNSQNQGQLQGQLQGQSQDQSQKAIGVGVGYSEGSSADNSVTITEAENLKKSRVDIRNNPDVIAPGLVTSNGTCMGSTSVGASGALAGVSLGTTWTSEECNLRYNSKHLESLGFTDAAALVSCQVESMRIALDIANPGVCGRLDGPSVASNEIIKSNAIASTNNADAPGFF